MDATMDATILRQVLHGLQGMEDRLMASQRGLREDVVQMKADMGQM